MITGAQEIGKLRLQSQLSVPDPGSRKDKSFTRTLIILMPFCKMSLPGAFVEVNTVTTCYIG